MTLHYRVHTQGHLLKPDHCTCLRGLKQGLMRSHRGDVQVLHWTGRHRRTDRTHRRIARAAARRARWSASWSRLISSSVRSKSGSTSSSQGFTASTRPVMRVSQAYTTTYAIAPVMPSPIHCILLKAGSGRDLFRPLLALKSRSALSS